MTICTVPDCGRKHYGRGYCDPHYQRVKRTGSPLVDIPIGGFPVDGERNHHWTKEPSYRTVHSRLTAQRGHARDFPCTDCGAEAKDWAYDYTDSDALTSSKGQVYSIDLDRYRPLCKRCHAQADMQVMPERWGWQSQGRNR